MSRTYESTHPWLRFTLDLRAAPHTLWLLLGEAQSKAEHVAGVPLLPSVQEHVPPAVPRQGRARHHRHRGQHVVRGPSTTAFGRGTQPAAVQGVSQTGDRQHHRRLQRDRWSCVVRGSLPGPPSTSFGSSIGWFSGIFRCPRKSCQASFGNTRSPSAVTAERRGRTCRT